MRRLLWGQASAWPILGLLSLSAQPAPPDLVITNAQIVDGTGAPGRRGSVVVAQGRVVSVGDATPTQAVRTIDARGRVLAPGFIDMHSHSDMPLVIDGNLISYIGLGTVRELVIGEGDRPATAAEIKAMQALVAAAMKQGVFGVS